MMKRSPMMGVRVGGALALCALIPMGSPALVSASSLPSNPQPPAAVLASGSVATAASMSEFSLTISPTRLVVKPAAIDVTQEIKVVNGGQGPVSVIVDKRDFSGRLDGSLAFAEDAPYAASTWVTVEPTSFTIAAGATQIVTADIAVPANPEPGDHEVALVFLVPSGETADNVKINRGVAAPIYITAPGPVDESATISDLSASSFATGGPVAVTATVKNIGTVHRDFRGDSPLTISGAGDAAAFPDFTVIRGSTREVSTSWDPPLICVCHPTVSITNADGSVSSKSVRVIVFPLPLFGFSLAGLLLLVLALWWSKRSYRARVIEAAMRLNRAAGD